MHNGKIKVGIGKSFFDIFVFSLFIIGLIIFIILNKNILAYFVCMPLIIILILALMKMFIFKLEIYNSQFIYRNMFGKKYIFSLKDIKEINWDICYGKNNSKFGLIIIKTSDKKIEIYTHMKNSKALAGYILENVEKGKIDKKNISQYSINELNKHAKNLIDENYFIFNEEGCMENIPKEEIEKMKKRSSKVITNMVLWFILVFVVMIISNFCIYKTFDLNQTINPISAILSLIIPTLLIIIRVRSER